MKAHFCSPTDTYSIFTESSLNSTKPHGWLKRWLETQKSGLTGALEVAGFPFDSALWACEEIPHQSGAPWWPYEQTAYWIDGLMRCGILLNDSELTQKGEAQCRYVLQHQDAEGYLGPNNCKPPMVAGRWSHSVFFRALIAYAQSGHESEVAKALEKHFLGHPYDYSGHRDVCCVETMCWAYTKTKNPKLLELAEKTWSDFLDNAIDDDVSLTQCALDKDEPADCHGVTFCETLKLPAILYSVTGKQSYLDHAQKGFEKLDRHHMLVTGAPSSTESLRGVSALDAHETCDIADYTWAAGYFFMITGDVAYADKIERATFNALPGAVTKDFRALQYFSCPNQVILMENSTHTLAAAGGKFMTYRPRPGTECCTGQVHRPMPNYIARQWMLKDGNPSAVLYGPSEFNFQKNNTAITLTESTDYPFNDEISFRVSCSHEVEFGLFLRIPTWCDTASILINGQPHPIEITQGTFVELNRKWKQGDCVTLKLPMKVTLQSWPDDGVTIERGPLVFALPIQDHRRPDPEDPYQNSEFPAWGMSPVSDWNYGLETDKETFLKQIELLHSPITENPWLSPPIRLKVPAKPIPQWEINAVDEMDSIGGELIDPERNRWKLFPKKIHGSFLLTPALPPLEVRQSAQTEKEEHIELIPIGATCLRITTFPKIPPTD